MAESLVISSSQFSSQINENQFELTSGTEAKSYLDDEGLIEFYDLDKCIGCVKKCGIESPKVSKCLLKDDLKLPNARNDANFAVCLFL